MKEIPKKNIFAFDFDGTLTTKDSFIALCIFYAGKIKFASCILKFLPRLIVMKFGLCSAAKTKELIFAHFFSGMPLDDFNNLCIQFAKANPTFIKSDGIAAIKNALKNGICVIVSASAKDWIAPFFYNISKNKTIEYLTTEIEIDENNLLTGKFCGKNCKNKEKVRRIAERFPNRETYTLIAYGDSKGDKEMLEFADKGFYKNFHSNRKSSQIIIAEGLRFCITGSLAVAIQYLTYRFLLKICTPIIANSISYSISMSFNFILSSLFTFRVQLSTKKLPGFLLSHTINFFLQTIFLSMFIHFGIHKQFAPIPVYAICVPINFILVRLFFKS